MPTFFERLDQLNPAKVRADIERAASLAYVGAYNSHSNHAPSHARLHAEDAAIAAAKHAAWAYQTASLAAHAAVTAIINDPSATSEARSAAFAEAYRAGQGHPPGPPAGG